MLPITFEFVLSLDEFVELYSKDHRRQRFFSILIIFCSVLVITFKILFAIYQGLSWEAEIPWIVVAGYFSYILFRQFGALKRRLKPLWLSMPSIQSPTLVSIDEDGLKTENFHCKSHSNWSRFTHWGETKTMLILYEGLSPNGIPKRAVGDEQKIRLLRDLCIQYVGRTKLELNRGFDVKPVATQREP